MKKYSIELNERQIKEVIDATDFYSRILSGQLDDIMIKGIPLSKEINRTKVRFLLEELKREMFPELDSNESYGIYNPKLIEKAKILYDIHQTTRYTYSWSKEPKGGIQTWFSDPMQASNEDLPEVKEIK